MQQQPQQFARFGDIPAPLIAFTLLQYRRSLHVDLPIHLYLHIHLLFRCSQQASRCCPPINLLREKQTLSANLARNKLCCQTRRLTLPLTPKQEERQQTLGRRRLHITSATGARSQGIGRRTARLSTTQRSIRRSSASASRSRGRG